MSTRTTYYDEVHELLLVIPKGSVWGVDNSWESSKITISMITQEKQKQMVCKSRNLKNDLMTKIASINM